MGAKTISITKMDSVCTVCELEGVNPPHQLTAQVDQDSSGVAERLSCKCDLHGPIKTLYNFPVNPVNKKLFIELFEEDYGPLGAEPKPKAWV